MHDVGERQDPGSAWPESEPAGAAGTAALWQPVALGTEHGIEVETFQSNREYELIERIHACLDDGTRYIVINPAAFTPTSIALRDALSGVKIPFVEVHLSNIHARDAFRHKSYFSDLAAGVICGLGPQGYQFGLHFAISKLKTQ